MGNRVGKDGSTSSLDRGYEGGGGGGNIFRAEGQTRFGIPHSDALVCTADIANCMVRCLFVDIGSAVNILYWDCLKAMGINVELKPPEGPL